MSRIINPNEPSAQFLFCHTCGGVIDARHTVQHDRWHRLVRDLVDLLDAVNQRTCPADHNGVTEVCITCGWKPKEVADPKKTT